MNIRSSFLLAILLALGLWVGLTRVPTPRWPWPSSCNGDTPPWLGEMIGTAKALNLPGFQISWQDGRGHRTDCVAGWAGPRAVDGWLRTDHVMRYASLSKILASTVVMQLLAEGKLSEESRVIDQLGWRGPYADPRVEGITVGQLLRHTAGFDRALSGDPMMAPYPRPFDSLHYLRTVRLDHAPGTHYAYANVGYHLLGVLIERIEGQLLEAVFRQRLIQPAGAASFATLRPGLRALGEPRNRFDPNESATDLLAFDYSSMVATGAWAGTAADFLTLLQTIFDSGPKGLLNHSQQQALLAVDGTCPTELWRKCHGFGFYRYEQKDKTMMHWRDGSLPGVSSFVGLFADGSKVVFLANGRDHDWMPGNDRIGQALYVHLLTPTAD